MTERSEAQILGSQGETLVAHVIDSTGCWIPRTQEKDYGIDMEAELSSPSVSGQLLKLQIKASKSISVSDRGVPCRISKKLASYADSCRLPVILVRVDLQRKQAWYLWLQQWLLTQRRSGLSLNDLPDNSTHYIPTHATLIAGLQKELRDIAQWQTDIQLTIAVNDAIHTAASVNDYDVLSHLVALLDRLDVINESFPVNNVIERALALGPNLWATDEGNKASKTLYSICRHFGRSFSADQISRMVTREEYYSRTGINALGILYDKHFGHIAKLNLVLLFLKHPDLRIAYYCNLREQCPGCESIVALHKAYDIKFAGLQMAPIPKMEFLNKWANRGDSALLDYLYDPAEISS